MIIWFTRFTRVEFLIPPPLTNFWTCPPGVNFALFSAIGGGAAGGDVTANPFGNNGAWGGGAGELLLRWPFATQPGATYQIVLGYAGSLRPGTGDTSGNGGTTFITPGAGGFAAGGRTGVNNQNQGGKGGGPNGGDYSGNQFVISGFPGAGLDSPRHFGGAQGGGTPSNSPSVSGGPWCHIPGGPQVGAYYSGAGGGSTMFGVGGSGARGDFRRPELPYTNPAHYGAGGGGSPGAPSSSIGYAGDGVHGWACIEYPIFN